MLMLSRQSCLLVVDVQERLVPAMSDPARVVKHCGVLMQAARRLEIPVVVSEQYPRGLGSTVPALRDYLPPDGAAAKMQFSCADDPGIMQRIEATGRRQVVVAGVEAHVCVLQTALGLLGKGFEVYVVQDACASRNPDSEMLAAERMRHAGVGVVSVEMAVFEWLAAAGTPAFKELSALIR